MCSYHLGLLYHFLGGAYVLLSPVSIECSGPIFTSGSKLVKCKIDALMAVGFNLHAGVGGWGARGDERGESGAVAGGVGVSGAVWGEGVGGVAAWDAGGGVRSADRCGRESGQEGADCGLGPGACTGSAAVWSQ
jgi:hypothetical protein